MELPRIKMGEVEKITRSHEVKAFLIWAMYFDR